jgi:1,4-alpha-glucan branching enzyme
MSAVSANTLEQEVSALLGGNHWDPFSLLGMHVVGPSGDVEVRVFLPGADRVFVEDLDNDRSVELPRIQASGFFAGKVGSDGERFDYRLKIATAEGIREIEDPYCFPPLLGDLDIHLLAQGNHFRSYEKLGAHPTKVKGVAGTGFAVWAPNARRVSVVGDFNGWDGRVHVMRIRHDVGIWELFLPGVDGGALYKFEIKTRDGHILLKSDPYAMAAECRPKTASVVSALGDPAPTPETWRSKRLVADDRRSPISIYEVHLGSWRRKPEEGTRPLTYLELAEELVPYVKDMGFTHVEIMPIAEFPFDGSWGYQPTGLFAPTSRYGSPEDFQTLVRRFHEAGIGVILDWVGGHFPDDAHGLARFDGTHLYEHHDPRLGRHQDWDTLVYNYGRREVSNFLLSNALYWFDRFGVDGLRCDAVAAMLYRDYSRKAGEWIPNEFGGRENLEAIDFLKRLNSIVYERYPHAMTVAEESTAWPMVSRPVHLGGLGFGYKWNMGWMNDTLRYMSREPIHRRYHHDDLTFGLLYAFTENFILPLSHDEVVHGKGSLLSKMPGDRWQKFANLRAYLGFMYAHPGKKLLFMGGEFAQGAEWSHDHSLDWHLLDQPDHAGMQRLVRDLNHLYRQVPALYELDCEAEGFAWLDCHDPDDSVLSFLRRSADGSDAAVVICNFTPVVRHGYRVGVPFAGAYDEILNTDSTHYGGSDIGNAGRVEAEAVPEHGQPCSLSLTLPPLATLVLRPAARP